MWFKNLCLYRFTSPFELDPEELEQKLAEKRFHPLGKLQPSTLGWSEPLGKKGEQLLHSSGGYWMLCARREEKILPAAAVRELLEARLDEIEEREGRRIRGKEKQRLRDEVLLDMMPRAFSRNSRQYAYLDLRHNWLVIDSASSSRAEEFIGLLRDTLGSLPVVPLKAGESPSGIMTRWLRERRPPENFTLADECELRASGDEEGIVRIRREDLFSEEVRVHLDAGKRVTRLALVYDERIRFLLNEELQLKRLRFEDVVLDEAAETGAETPAEHFDADFSLMTLELARLLPRLTELFGSGEE